MKIIKQSIEKVTIANISLHPKVNSNANFSHSIRHFKKKVKKGSEPKKKKTNMVHHLQKKSQLICNNQHTGAKEMANEKHQLHLHLTDYNMVIMIYNKQCQVQYIKSYDSKHNL